MLIYILPIFIFLFFILFLYRKRKSYYPYSASQDYFYQFPNAKFFKANCTKGKISLPKDTENCTVFLKLKVKSSLLGNFIQPYIKISSTDKTKIQREYLEYGVNAVRYLNLSAFSGGSDIFLEGVRATVKDQEFEVIYYLNPSFENKRILFVAPHPDDAEVAGYGLYKKYASNSFILTLSAGERGKFKYRELYDKHTQIKEQHLKKGELRSWNALTTPLLAGVPAENVLMLGYFNEMLDDMYQEKDRDFGSDKLETFDVNTFRKFNFSNLSHEMKEGANWKSLIENLQIVITDFQPDIIVSPHPFIDAHEDHQYSTIAIIEALKSMDYSKGKYLFYTNHYKDFEYYPIGKLGSTMSLPPKFDDSIYFQSLYSYNLSEEEQIDKILAFDTMNDLRPNTEYRIWYRLFADGFTRLREQLFSIEKDYFNRYIKSNELFYVVEIKDLFLQENYSQLLNGKRTFTSDK